MMITFRRHLVNLNVVPVNVGPCGQCDMPIDDRGEHFLTCPHLGRGANHDAVKKTTRVCLRPAAAKGGFTVSNNEPSLTLYKKDSVTDDLENRADIGMYYSMNRTNVLIDVRTATLVTPQSMTDVGMSANAAEKAKRTLYERRYAFPEGVEFVPFGIDSYGRWGEEFKTFLKSTFKRAAGLDRALYNKLITGARDMIAVANLRAVASRIAYGIRRCITRPEDRARLVSRYYGLKGFSTQQYHELGGGADHGLVR
jgi:hypothetical protein